MKQGLDTLQENEDKDRFFAELEQGKETPIDYSELNKKLSESGGHDTPTRYGMAVKTEGFVMSTCLTAL